MKSAAVFASRCGRRFFLITLACAVLANFLTARNWFQAKGQVAKAQRELGLLVVEDPSQFNVVKVHSWQCWSWRVYLPPGRKYRVMHQIGKIPEEGFPKTSNLSGFEFDAGELEVNYALKYDRHGSPHLVHFMKTIASEGVSGAIGKSFIPIETTVDWLDADRITLLEDQYLLRGGEDEPDRYFRIDVDGVTRNYSGRPILQPADTPLELVRVRAIEFSGPQKLRLPDPFPKVQKDVPEFPELTDGLLIWIEPVP